MYAYDEALRMRAPTIDITQIFLGAIRADKRIMDILLDLGLTDEKLRNVMQWITLENRIRAKLADFRELGSFQA